MGAQPATELVTREEARYLSLVAQGIEPMPGAAAPAASERDRLLAIVRRAGVVQLDSISVVSRAHETIVWSRAGNFAPAQLNALHHPEGRLFEYWAHAASLLPIEFFPYVRRKMHAYRNPDNTNWGKWAAEHRPLLDEVKRTVTDQGALSTRAFERPQEIQRRPWDWFGGKPAKQALDCLWTMGELTVVKRVGFERYYDLTERVFPDLAAAPLPSQEEEAAFFARRALSAVGVGTLPWIADYYRSGSTRYVPVAGFQRELEELARTGAAVPIVLEDQRAPAWLDAALVPALDAFRAGDARPLARTLLCPFDNILWQRTRALALFGFDYRLESYTPEPKRIYGYYTLPILIDGRLVGRLDARYRRKERVLSVHALHLEPSVKATAALAGTILAILRRFLRFLGGGRIEVLLTSPETLHGHLTKRLG